MGDQHADGKPIFHAETLAQWRDWLAANHASEKGVWLVVWKKATGRPTLDYPDTVDEALAYGWIDSRPNTLDDERAMRWFTPRNPTSPWSRINKAKIAALTVEGRLAPAGQALVETAKANGAWEVYDEIEDLVIPADLATALAADALAAANFMRFPDSSKKNILWWIKSAKADATRTTRIASAIALAAENRMANHPKGRDAGPKPR
jgi:uncharacterized protein YdeI (YjbR/CyaY-like superfamily)